MGKIFHYAAKVLVWLGEGDESSDMLFDHIKPHSVETWRNEWTGLVDSRFMHTMMNFYQKPYWRRIWVIQEILGAKSLDIFCGKNVYQWIHTARASRLSLRS